MRALFSFIFLLFFLNLKSQSKLAYSNDDILTGAQQTERYVPYLKGLRVAILANPSSVVKKVHLVDTLRAMGVDVVKIFGPEHGFRGGASNGAKVYDEVDPVTNIPVVSLYGNKKKPSRLDLADVDIVIYDVQDLGVRFYTYINVLRDLMEVCAEYDKELMILDRPNPNAYLIDGPIMDMKHKSGIGQFPLPIAHGLTTAEFAQMVKGEGWMVGAHRLKLHVVPIANYRHDMLYKLPVDPSPNLNTEQSIILYPSTCLFEGVKVNHGRGTDFPFVFLGAPMYKGVYSFSFIPVSKKGKSESPLYMNETCYGLDLRNYDLQGLIDSKRLNLGWIIEFYANSPEKDNFFDQSFSKQIGSIEKLVGVDAFRRQVESGWTEEQIRASWEPGLSVYKVMRKKYLLYLD